MKTERKATRSAADAKGSDQSQNTSIRRKRSALAVAGLLLTSLFALPTAHVEAQCQQWNLGHGWQLKQGPTIVHMSLRQEGTRVTGTAKFFEPRSKTVGFYDIDDSRNVSGKVIGTVNGDTFTMRIVWNNNTVGIYNGAIDPSGKMDGTAYEARSASTRVKWRSETTMICRDAEPAKKPADPAATRKELEATADTWLADEVQKRKTATPPTTSTGNRGFINGLQLGTPTPAPKTFTPTQGEAGKSTRPFIRALPQIVSMPRGESEALTKLVWFAGNDHPDARLVVEINGGDEQLVDPQRKGSRQVKVKAGRKYKYSLVDAGEPLASVIVQTDQSAPPPNRQRQPGEQREGRQDGEGDENREED